MATTFTGSFSVTIFNAHADEEVPDTGTGVADGTAQLYGAEAGAAGSAVSSNEVSNALDIAISGASVTGTGGDLVPPTEFPLPHNIIGGVLSGASNRLFDMEDGVAVSQMYTMGRVMHWCMPQTRNMVASATRADQVQEWKDLRADNPLVSAGFHFSPFLTTRGYREKTSDFRRYLYDYLQTQSREQVLAHIDSGNWKTELNNCETPASGFAQTLVAINPNHTGDPDSGLREWMSDAWTDFVCGTTLSTLPITAGDVSDFLYCCTDNTAINKLGPNDDMEETWQTGTVSSISSYRSGTSNTHVKTLVLSKTPPTGSENAAILFFPAYVESDSDTHKKFIAYRIDSFSGSTVTLRNLPKKATDTQTAVPASGWRYAINNPDETTRNVDWDIDGNTETNFEGAADWNPKLIAVHDLVNSKVLAATGHESMRGWNGIGGGFTGKKNGWRVPHDQSESQDIAIMENASSAHWKWKTDSSTQKYQIKQYIPKEHQEALHWAGTFIRNPSNFAKQHARGAFVEFMVWGDGETNHTWEVAQKNAIDAHAARYHLACSIPVQNVNFSIQIPTSITELQTIYAITEQFLDLETGGVEPEDFGTYREGKGETSDTERLKHDWTWRTPDAGERIYIYRCGDFLVCVNMADKPRSGGRAVRSDMSYPEEYSPPAHSSPYPVRNNHDQIKKADWDALEDRGILNSTEKLKKIDATTYVNDRATAFLQSQAPTIWGPDNPKGSFSYGPKQATPFDNIATPLSELDLVIHDDDWNDGSEVSRTETLELPVWTAYFLQIYEPASETA